MQRSSREHSSTTITERAPLRDVRGRRIDQLRVSVTARCDLRCSYCRPHGATECTVNDTPLSDRQRLELVRLLHRRFGLQQVRVTGGEPLVHPTIVEIVRELRRALPDVALAMTTNGTRLAKYAERLRGAGLDRLNVSLDSLRPATYERLTGGRLQDVFDGIGAAIDAGFAPPKVNAVVLNGVNDGELVDLAQWAFARGMEVRFLEAMPIGSAAEANGARFVSADEMLEHLAREFEIEALPEEPGATARRYLARGPGQTGTFGLIAPITRPFCGGCRRMRLTADAKLYPCLLDSRFVDLRTAWRRDAWDTDAVGELVHEAAAGKQAEGPQRQAAAMTLLGG